MEKKPECFKIGAPDTCCTTCEFVNECDPTDTLKEQQFIERHKHIPDEDIVQIIKKAKNTFVKLEKRLRRQEDVIKDLQYLLKLRKEKHE